jgi:hypothetical protein
LFLAGFQTRNYSYENFLFWIMKSQRIRPENAPKRFPEFGNLAAMETIVISDRRTL